MEMSHDLLTAKILYLMDIENIKKLKHQYCSFCDQQYDPEGISSLFSEDGVWDGGNFGKAEGRAAIKRHFENSAGQVGFVNHYVTNPIINIDGLDATGTWDLWQPMVMEQTEPTAFWLVGKYDETYKKIDDQWFFNRLHLTVVSLAPHDSNFGTRKRGNSDTEHSTPRQALTKKQAIKNAKRFLAVMATDLPKCQDYMSSSFTWQNFLPSIVPFGGEYVGLDGIKRYLAEMDGQWKFGDLEFSDFVYDPESRVLAAIGVEKDGVALSTSRSCDMAFVWEFRFDESGRVSFLREYNDTQAITAAFEE